MNVEARPSRCNWSSPRGCSDKGYVSPQFVTDEERMEAVLDATS